MALLIAEMPSYLAPLSTAQVGSLQSKTCQLIMQAASPCFQKKWRPDLKGVDIAAVFIWSTSACSLSAMASSFTAILSS